MKQEPSTAVCTDCVVFCGLQDRKYPDARSMGYPFDRQGDDYTFEFNDFLFERENMAAIEITIRHIDEIVKYVSADNLIVANGDKDKKSEKKDGKDSSTSDTKKTN